VRIYHPPADGERVRFETRVPVARGAAPDYWKVFWDALNSVLASGGRER